MKTINNNETNNQGKNAEYFLNLSQVYRNDRNHSYPWNGDLANGLATVARKNMSDGMIYTIHTNDAQVYQRDFKTQDLIKKMSIEEFKETDLEFASPILIYKCGYIILDSPNNVDSTGYITFAMSTIMNYIGGLKEDNLFVEDKGKRDTPIMCGCCGRDEFQYYAINGIEVHVQNIHNFCEENETRKFYEMKSIPFIKSMNSANSFHVTFVDFNRKEFTNEEQVKRCNQALKELIGYITNALKPYVKAPEDEFEGPRKPSFVNYGATTVKWINTKLSKPLYETL